MGCHEPGTEGHRQRPCSSSLAWVCPGGPRGWRSCHAGAERNPPPPPRLLLLGVSSVHAWDARRRGPPGFGPISSPAPKHPTAFPPAPPWRGRCSPEHTPSSHAWPQEHSAPPQARGSSLGMPGTPSSCGRVTPVCPSIEWQCRCPGSLLAPAGMGNPAALRQFNALKSTLGSQEPEGGKKVWVAQQCPPALGGGSSAEP